MIAVQPPPRRSWSRSRPCSPELLSWRARSGRTRRTLVTITHEGAHGVAALLTGRRLQGIRLHWTRPDSLFPAGEPAAPA